MMRPLPFSPLVSALIFASICAPLSAFGADLYAKNQVTVSASGADTFSVSAPAGVSIEVTAVSNPPRIVIDLLGKIKGDQRVVPLSSNTFVKSVRTGTHPDKMRIVLDVVPASQGEEFPPYKVNKSDHAVTITFGNTGAAKAITSATPAVKQASSPAMTTTTTSKHAAPSTISSTTSTTALRATTSTTSPTSTTTVTTTVTTSTIHTPAAAQVDDRDVRSLTLSAVSFESGEVVGIKFVTSGKADFKLARKSEKEYLLVLENCRLAGPHLQYPFYPPQDVEGITHVIMTMSGNNTNVTIGVERTVKLSAAPKEEEILVSVKGKS